MTIRCYAIFFSIILIISSLYSGTIYFVADHWGTLFQEKIMYIDGVALSSWRDGCRDHIQLLKHQLNRKGYSVQQVPTEKLWHITLKSYDAVIFFDLTASHKQLNSLLARFKPEQLLLFIWEPPSICPLSYDQVYHTYFAYIFTWYDTLVDNKRYIKLYYPHSLVQILHEHVDFDQKKLCCMILSNKFFHETLSCYSDLYRKRSEIVRFFEQYAPHEFDLFGFDWPKHYTIYKGLVTSKKEYLKNYKFCIAYENTADIPGYITEKIFDAMTAGCVPIYWGASNIQEYIPSNCFIDARHFTNLEELYIYLKGMQRAEYVQYLDNIQAYVTSEAAFYFSCEYFVRMVMEKLWLSLSV